MHKESDAAREAKHAASAEIGRLKRALEHAAFEEARGKRPLMHADHPASLEVLHRRQTKELMSLREWQKNQLIHNTHNQRQNAELGRRCEQLQEQLQKLDSELREANMNYQRQLVREELASVPDETDLPWRQPPVVPPEGCTWDTVTVPSAQEIERIRAAEML